VCAVHRRTRPVAENFFIFGSGRNWKELTGLEATSSTDFINQAIKTKELFTISGRMSQLELFGK